MRQTQEELLMFSSTKLLSSAFTAAVTDIITVTGHGYVGGEKVRVSTTTTLPGGLSASTDYYVVDVINANTFYLSTAPGGTHVNITSTGTGTHTMVLKSKVLDVEDFKNVILNFNTAGSGNFTAKLQGSIQDDVDFESAASATNRWDYIQMVDLQDGSTIAGDTGFAVTGTDDNRILEANVNGLKWICIDITSWTAGTLTVGAALYRD